MCRLIVVFLFSFCGMLVSPAHAVEPTSALQLESRDLIMTLEKVEGTAIGKGIRLVSLIDKKSGHEFCAQPNRPLFSLVLQQIDASKKQHTVVSDQCWDSVTVQKKRNTLTISWSGCNSVPGAEQVTAEMQITADPERDGIEVSQSAKAGSDQISIVLMRLGQLAVRDFGADTKLFYPFRSGVVTDNPCEKSFNWRAGYPGFDAAMPWFVIWDEKTPNEGFRSKNHVGLYLGFHDPQGCRKVLVCTAKPTEEKNEWPNTVSFWAEIHVEDLGEPNNQCSIGGKAVLRTVQNDWYDGARIYRDWVRNNANWFPRERMGENGRTDSPQWLKEQCLWAMYRVDPEEMIPAMRKMRDAFGVPAAVHWYYWHKNPYDNDYPHFFPRDGFAGSVAEMQNADDIFIMPYTNGLLWDSHDRGLEDWRYTKEGLAGAVKNENGIASLHSYGSKESDGSDVTLAHMCSATEVWQKKVRENTLRLLNEYGVKAVYIDQVGAAIPELCFDKTHGHPLGGGHWWGDGYKKMLETIRADMRREVADFPFCETVKQRLSANSNALNDRAITTECTGETSLGLVDGFLTWHHQVENQVPAFAAVYGGTVQMIGRDYRAGKTYAERTEPKMIVTNEPLACRMKSAEALCFGEQIGWFVPTIIDESDKFPYQRKIVRLRHLFRHYFYQGEMCRAPEFPVELPRVTADWNYYDSPLISAPAVRSGCWKISKNGQTKSVVLLFANTSEEPITCPIRVNLSELGFDDKADRLSITQYNPEGFEKEIEPEKLAQPVTFPAESVFAWEILSLR